MLYLHTHWRTIKILSFPLKTDVEVNIFSEFMKDWKKMIAFKAPFSQSTRVSFEPRFPILTHIRQQRTDLLSLTFRKLTGMQNTGSKPVTLEDDSRSWRQPKISLHEETWESSISAVIARKAPPTLDPRLQPCHRNPRPLSYQYSPFTKERVMPCHAYAVASGLRCSTSRAL